VQNTAFTGHNKIHSALVELRRAIYAVMIKFRDKNGLRIDC